MRLKSRRAAHLLVSTAAVLATLTACGPPSNLPHVTMVGDSTLAGMVWYDQAGVTRSQDVVRAAYDLTLDAESCRRLVAPSCRGRFGYVPNTTMDVLRANRGRLGEAVVIMGGYDDISIGDAVPQILAETEAQGVKHVIWLTYPLNVPYVLPSGFPARSLYANHNLVLYLNSINHPTLHLADWNTYSAGHREWFGTDGIHLTAAGTMALASYLRGTARPVRRRSRRRHHHRRLRRRHHRLRRRRPRHRRRWPPRRRPPRPSRPRRRPDGQGSRYSPPGARTARPSATTPAATRAARTSSSGQPMVLPRWAALTGPRPRARTRRPRPWRSEPTKGDCGRLVCADPDAGSGAGHPAADHEHDRAHGQRLALRTAGPADGGAEVEQGLVPGPALALRHGRVGQRLDLPGRSGRPDQRAQVRATLVSTMATSASKAKAMIARAVYGPTPGRCCSSAIVRGKTPPKSRSTAPAAACSRTARPL